MKKTLSILILIGSIGCAASAMAAPPEQPKVPHPAHHRASSEHFMGRGQVMHGHHAPMPMHRPMVHTVGFVRHGYWRTPPYCNFTVRYVNNNYYTYPYYPEEYYSNSIYLGIGIPFF